MPKKKKAVPKKRPDEQKTERFNMFMSPSEMKAIDDWAWGNRIRSKSEAVRRLCHIAWSLDYVIPNATHHASKMLSANRLHYYQVSAIGSKLDRGEPVTQKDVKDMTWWAADLLDRAEAMLLILMRENNRIVSLMNQKNIKTAFAVSNTADEEMSKIMEGIFEKKVLRESKYLAEVIKEMTEEETRYSSLKKEIATKEIALKLDAYLLGKIAKKRDALEDNRPQPYRRPAEDDK